MLYSPPGAANRKSYKESLHQSDCWKLIILICEAAEHLGCLKFLKNDNFMLFSCIYLPYFDSDTPGQKRTAKMGAGRARKRKKKQQNKGVMLVSK